ncbi:ribosome biogenesis GTPase YlqF [Psychrobium sp. 1_MG-2023]|uniref:ribosome biogenesis GTPase YlqF n=1 Tax=Psychrobium sp. 1_MG-2023 TaxID=3062624 RepID=UPI000C33FEA3|nr:ribosome biogenesis GTPase YlqF [Psychrobium sp. 1_MG-2023]MDP2560161.1 ribosome biogenesis GTPase YlqF [Psychrobium sp. 1_MG-2023]PKF56973.1 ribosome biogenesis GTPase YlqF [Alteromonadales bacterium alter-6D02]
MSRNSIQWFPGHMHKARKEMSEVMGQIDIIIEVVDARIPYSSENPFAQELRGDKPLIKVLNKCDLADDIVVAQWQEHLDQQRGVSSLAITASEPTQVNKILDLCRKLVPHRDEQGKDIRALIMGIPNVGKSTIINILAGRIIAKTGNEPAVTKRQQRINLKNGIVLCDTPGILWPKVHNEHSGYRLAITGAIKDTAFEYEDIASYAAEYLMQAYPELIKARYKLEQLPQTEWELVEEIGAVRGFKRAGGRVDMHKTCEILLHEFRQGMIGDICLETPEMAVVEQEIVEQKMAEAALSEQTKKKKPKKKRRR